MNNLLHLDNVDAISRAPNGIKLLRQLILRYAVSGKLVPHYSSEGSGFELVEKILRSRKIEVGPENNPSSEMPENWGRAKLGEIFHLEMGQSPKSDSYNSRGEGLPFHQGKTDFGSFVPTPRVWCSSPTKIAQPGDVLLSVRAPVGPTNYADEKCCIGRGLAAIRPLGGMSTEFVLWWLRAYETQIAEMGTGTTFIAVSKKNLEPFMLGIPPLGEQNRILARIKELMTLCDSLEYQLSLGKQISTAARRSAVDSILNARDIDEFQIAWDRIQENWEVIAGTPAAIDSLRKLILSFAATGKLVDSADRFTNNSTSIELLKVCKVSWGNLSLTKSAYIENGPHLAVSAAGPDGRIGIAEHKAYTPVLSAIGARCGTMFMPEEDFTAIKNTMTLEPKDELLDNWYLFYTMMGSDLPRRGSAQPFMSKSDIENFKIRVPSMNEQKLISKSVEALLEKCDLLESKLKDLEKIAEQFARSVVLRST